MPLSSPMIKPDDPQDPSMRYGMIGDDRSTELEKLAKYTGDVTWSYLKPHYESGALLYLDPSQDITVVGKALADDDKEAIQSLLKSGDLVKPSAPHAAYWEESNPTFTALVVSPFVLVQPTP